MSLLGQSRAASGPACKDSVDNAWKSAVGQSSAGVSYPPRSPVAFQLSDPPFLPALGLWYLVLRICCFSFSSGPCLFWSLPLSFSLPPPPPLPLTQLLSLFPSVCSSVTLSLSRLPDCDLPLSTLSSFLLLSQYPTPPPSCLHSPYLSSR